MSANATKFLRRVGFLLLGLLLIFLLLHLLVFVFINPIAEAMVKESIKRGSHGLYTAQFDRLWIDLIGRDIQLKEFHLLPDPHVLKARQKQGILPQTLIELETKQLEIEEVDWLAYWRHKDILIEGIRVNQPVVKIRRSQQETGSLSQEKSQALDVSAYLHALAINEIVLKDGTFYFIENESQRPQHEIQNVSIRLTDLKSDSLRMDQAINLLATGNMTIQIKDYTYHFPDSSYTCKLGEVNISTLHNQLLIHQISVLPDTVINQQRKAAGKAMRNLYGFNAEQVEITNFDVLDAYQRRKLSIDQIIVDHPEVSVLQDKSIPSQAPQQRSNAFEVLSKWLDQVTINEFAIRDGKLVLHMLQDKVQTSQVVERVSLQLLKLRIDSLQSPDPKEHFYAEDIRLGIKDYTYYLPDSLYLLKVGEISTSYLKGEATIRGVRFQPRYKKAAFMRRVPYRTERKDIKIETIVLKKADLKALFNEQRLDAGSLIIENARVQMYRDNRKPLDDKRHSRLLHQMLKEAPFAIHLEEVKLRDIDIQYEEIAENGHKPGIITLENLQGSMYQVSNDAKKLKQDSSNMRVDIQLDLMGKARLDVDFDFPLASTRNDYTFKGKLSAIDAKELNRILEPLTFMRLEEGRIQSAEFQVYADDENAAGSMKLYYNDLKVRLLERAPKDNASSLKHDAGTFLANTLVLKSDNPSGKKPLRVGEITESRDKRRSMIYHCVQSLMCGVRSSILTTPAERIVARKIEKKKAQERQTP